MAKERKKLINLLSRIEIDANIGKRVPRLGVDKAFDDIIKCVKELNEMFDITDEESHREWIA